jgi:hypothetical protein
LGVGIRLCIENAVGWGFEFLFLFLFLFLGFPVRGFHDMGIQEE